MCEMAFNFKQNPFNKIKQIKIADYIKLSSTLEYVSAFIPRLHAEINYEIIKSITGTDFDLK
jgi:hypothetical protein